MTDLFKDALNKTSLTGSVKIMIFFVIFQYVIYSAVKRFCLHDICVCVLSIFIMHI